MAGELNKFTLNNEIVLMRHDVRKARVCLVHKITRTIKSLRSGKGSKEPSEKDLLKADKLVEEIRTLKKLEIDNITKTLLVYVDDPVKVLSDIRKSLEDRVIAKMFTIKSMETSISKFRRKYPNWLEDVPALLKTMKKKKPKKKIKDNPKKIITSAGDNDRPAALKNCESNGGVPEIIEKNKNNVKASIRSTSGSWTVSGSVENLCIGNEGSSKKGKLKRVTKPKIPPNVGKITKNGEKIGDNEEFDEGSSTNAKRLRVDSDMESEEGGGERRDIVSGLKKPENDQKNVEKNREDSKKFKRNITKFNMEKDEDSFGSRIKVGERIDNEKVMFELGKKDLKLEVGLKSSKNGIDDDRFQLTKTIDKKFSDGMNGVDEDLEKRFKNSKKPDKPVSGKKKEEIKVADPFFMTNDNSEYLTVVSSKEQAEALQNPSETSSNYRNNDEELYYGSSLTGGFKQISHHERRKSMVTNLSRGSTGFPDRNFRQFGKDGGRNEANFKNRESLSSSSHALPRRERRRLMNGGGKETKIDGEEKLHPSWEAKRRQSCPAIPQFSGKKIVFDD